MLLFDLTPDMDIHTEPGSHWVAIHLDTMLPKAYYFDSYGLLPFVPNIRNFLRRTCNLWSYNNHILHGFTTDVCGEYACLFEVCTNLGLALASLLSRSGQRSRTCRCRRLSCGSLSEDRHAPAAPSETGSAAPA